MPEDTKAVATDVKEEKKTDDGKEVNVGMAVLAYIIFFIPLLTDSKDDPFVKFHVKQGMLLVIAWVVVSVVCTIIPFLGWFILGPASTIFFLVLWIMGIINAVNKQMKPLPLIGKYAEEWFKF